uniref:Centrosomal protein of 19 kDa n=1 Tax=Strongyloides venezuelensis TaxID=75913 RepID=A0A0K0FRQ5_STRVS
MMLLDPNTNKLTIEKLSSQIRVKYLRNPADQIVQIIREKIQSKKGTKKEKTSEICRSQEREKSTPIRNPSIFNKLKEVKTLRMEEETTTEDLLQGLDIDSPKNVNEDVVKNEEKPSVKGAINISDFEDSSDDDCDDILDKAVGTKQNTIQGVASGTAKISNNTSNAKVNSEKAKDDFMDFFDNIDDVSNKNFPKSPKKPSPESVKKVIPQETKSDPFSQNIFGSLDESSDEDPIVEKNDKHKTVENKNSGQNKKMVGPGGRMWHDDLDLSEDEDSDDD